MYPLEMNNCTLEFCLIANSAIYSPKSINEIRTVYKLCNGFLLPYSFPIFPINGEIYFICSMWCNISYKQGKGSNLIPDALWSGRFNLSLPPPINLEFLSEMAHGHQWLFNWKHEQTALEQVVSFFLCMIAGFVYHERLGGDGGLLGC